MVNNGKEHDPNAPKQKLTLKQTLFVEYYLALDNGKQAAIKAGYSKRTAKQIASENLAKPYLQYYIKKGQDEIKSKAIATKEEVLEFYTSVARGEIKDAFGMEAGLDTRLDAVKQLGKRYGLDKIVVETNHVEVPSITVVLAVEETYGDEKE